MPLLRPLEYLHRHTVGLPWPVRYGATLGLVGAAFGLRVAADPWLDSTAPFTLFYPAVLASALAFANGAGYVAAAASAVASIYFLPPFGQFVMPTGPGLVALGLFGVCGMLTALTVETLHHAVRGQREALAAGAEATRRRALLLTEYRHRMRGDLQALASLVRLRARYVADPTAQRALQEAAGHAVTLGRIHRRLEQARHDEHEVAVVDSAEFVRGVCADLAPPVMAVGAVSRALSTERSVALGLMLVELVGEARAAGAGQVVVRLAEAGGDYVLDVIDDRGGLAEPDGLRARLVALLAAQLRGSLTRTPNHAGPGLAVALRFPVLAPVLAPGRVGA
jgi:two-component sensor histidine kinase